LLDKCCNICAAPGAVKIPDGKNGSYDWDFITMDAFWVPQFCQALSEGHDFTVTNVASSSCVASPPRNSFQLHGLWPSYYINWSQCCQTPAPLRPNEVSSWTNLHELHLHWSDPAVDTECSVCFNLNHEWQKHGGCFTDNPESYFATGLELFKQWQTNLEDITSWFSILGANGDLFNATELQRRLNRNARKQGKSATKILAQCDKRGEKVMHNGLEVMYVSEIQWCLHRKEGVFKGVPVTTSDLELFDCPGESNCGDVLAIRPGSKAEHTI